MARSRSDPPFLTGSPDAGGERIDIKKAPPQVLQVLPPLQQRRQHETSRRIWQDDWNHAATDRIESIDFQLLTLTKWSVYEDQHYRTAFNSGEIFLRSLAGSG